MFTGAIYNFRGIEIPVSYHDVLLFENLVHFDLNKAVQGLTLANKDILVKSFKLFFLASVIIRRGLVGLRVNPTKEQDAVWHLTLKRTKLYRAFSYAAAGFFVQHDPTMPPKELVRLSGIEYGQLAHTFYKLAPDFMGYFDDCIETYCFDDHFDNSSLWKFRQEFEDLQGIMPVEQALHSVYTPCNVEALADTSVVEDTLRIRDYDIQITHDDIQRYRNLVSHDIQLFLARLPHPNRRHQLIAFKLFFWAHILFRKKGKLVRPSILPQKVWDLSFIYTIVYDQFSHAVAGYFVDSLDDEEETVSLTVEEYISITKMFYRLAPETDGFFTESLKFGYLVDNQALAV